jgi:biopolymer transport protein ExbD
MRVAKKEFSGIQEGDMTPMIDMAFQLIAFFTVMINFTESEQNALIKLPQSELAKPPDGPLEFPITIHLTSKGTAIMTGEEVYLEGLRPFLVREADVLSLQGRPQSEATVIIRADKNAKTGDVQKLIEICQKNNFEKFALRAEEKVE